MSFFSYGAPAGGTDPTLGVVISYVHTLSIDDEVMYSDDGTEYLYTQRTIRVRGIVSPRLSPATGQAGPADVLFDVRRQLETPRLQLWYSQNGATDPKPIIQSPKAGYGVDAKNGPFPKHVSIVQVQGSECLLVELEYVTYVVDCESGGGSANALYQSHRWRETYSIDDRFYTTVTRTGKITVRADLHSNPDSLRGLVTGGIPNGFKRMKAEYTLQEDGLALLYSFTDAEVYVEPPYPAVRAEGEYIESTSEGQLRHGEVRVRLEGAKTSDKGELLKVAITIAVFKLQLAGPLGFSPKWLVSGGVRESLYDNVVEVRFRCQIQQLPASTGGAAISLERFSQPLIGSSDLIPPDFGNRGTAGLRAIAAALHDPCLGTSLRTLTNEGDDSILRTRPIGPNSPDGTGGNPPAILRTIPVLPDGQTRHLLTVPVGGLDGVFTDYDMRTDYQYHDHTLQLPTCQQGGDAAIIQVASPTARKVVEFSAMRTGAQPKIPDPYELNTAFLHGSLQTYKMDVGADGTTPRYKVSGTYHYAYTKRSLVNPSYAVPPYLDPGLTVVLRAVPLDAFASGITSDAPLGTPGVWDQVGNVTLRGGNPP